MAGAGYSKRSLVDKLGIKPGTRVITVRPPSHYGELVGELPDGVTLQKSLPASAEFVHCFTRKRTELETDFPRLSRALADSGTLWISWPKRTSGVETDLNENIVREVGLATGLVDVKVCAIDETWSGLKFVRRLSNRAQ